MLKRAKHSVQNQGIQIQISYQGVEDVGQKQITSEANIQRPVERRIKHGELAVQMDIHGEAEPSRAAAN